MGVIEDVLIFSYSKNNVYVASQKINTHWSDSFSASCGLNFPSIQEQHVPLVTERCRNISENSKVGYICRPESVKSEVLGTLESNIWRLKWKFGCRNLLSNRSINHLQLFHVLNFVSLCFETVKQILLELVEPTDCRLDFCLLFLSYIVAKELLIQSSYLYFLCA